MKANRFAKDSNGVTAVIGVILLVAITVILAAVISAFVFGTAGGISTSYTVGATAQRISSSQIEVTYFGGQDVSHVAGLTVTSTTGSARAGISMSTIVGTTTIITGASADDTITVTAKWDDGTSSVIMLNTL